MFAWHLTNSLPGERDWKRTEWHLSHDYPCSAGSQLNCTLLNAGRERFLAKGSRFKALDLSFSQLMRMLPPQNSNGQVTLRTIGQAIGVSHVTVSLALRNSPKISIGRRQQIHEIARQIGYQPNVVATALARQKGLSSTSPVKAALAWLNHWPDPRKLRSFPELDRYWQGASAAAGKFGYFLEEFQCGKQMPLNRVEKILVARGIHGILLPPHRFDIGWETMQWERFSAVRLGRSIQNPRLHVVTSDQVANTMLTFRKALEKGYRRIGFITGNAAEYGALFRAGYLMAQAMFPQEAWLPVCSLEGSDKAAWRRQLTRWLKDATPDAVLTDQADASELFRGIGCRVPEDVGMAVMSVLDGDTDAGIDQHPEEIGRVAVMLLLSLIHDHAMGVPPIFRQVLVEGSWIDGSTMPDRTKKYGIG